MKNKFDLDLLKRFAKVLTSQFESNCEIIIHDLTTGNLEHTIAAIENGTLLTVRWVTALLLSY